MDGQERMRSQSALDFLSTYSFMFLIIAIALAVLIIYASLPNNVFPLNCEMYNTFGCIDAILTNTTTAGQSQLLVVFSDQVPGIINISSFTPTLDFKSAASGICTPSVAEVGQRVYCVATFNMGVPAGRIYSGTLKLSANYCASGVSNLSYSNCPSDSNFTYGGFIRIEASTLPQNELPLSASNFSITVTNTQNSGAIPAHFDVPVSFNPKDSALVTHERPDLGNIRFYYNSKELYSWCETNCSTSATGNAIFWVRIPQAISPPSSKRNVMPLQMYLLPITTEYSGVHAGEAPQLSPKYAEYDNGANVFEFYDNFVGTSLDTGKWNIISGMTYTVNNGFTYDGGSCNNVYITSIQNFTAPYIVDFMGSGPSTNDMGIWFAAAGRGTTTNTNLWAQRGTSGSDQLYTGNPAPNTFNGYSTSNGLTNGNFRLYSLLVGSNNNPIITQANYTTYINDTSFPSSYLNGYIGPRFCSGSETWQWIRVRQYPPGGVMPTVTVTT